MASKTGKVLAEWRRKSGHRLDDAAVELGRVLGHRVSRETIRRYENDYPVTKMDPVIVVALAEVYGTQVGELPADMRKVIRSTRDLLERSSPCMAAA